MWGCRLDGTDDGTFQETCWTELGTEFVCSFPGCQHTNMLQQSVTRPNTSHSNITTIRTKSLRIVSSSILCVHSVETLGCTLCLSCYASTCRPIVCLVSSFFLGALVKSWEATLSFVVSVGRQVCPSAWNNWAPTGRTLMEFGIWVFLKNI